MKAICGLMLSCLAFSIAFATDLTPEAQRAFDRYIRLAEAGLEHDLNAQHFLYGNPTAQQKTQMRKGDILFVPRDVRDNGNPIDVPGGLIQDWVGTLFMRGATIAQVRSVMQDYASYKYFYKPEVTASNLLRQNGNDYEIFLRMYKRQFLTVVVLNANYHVQYGDLDPQRMYINSRSTRIAEVKNPDRSLTEEEPVGHDDGYLWALNSYWRFEQADGGVYAQLEAISFSRDLPIGLAWLKGFLQKFPKDSMEATLKGTRRSVGLAQRRTGN